MTSQSFDSIPVWYLNLERSEDRKRHIELQLESIGVKQHKRICGLDGRQIKNIGCGELEGISYVNKSNAVISNSELGTVLSHLKIAKMLAEDETGLKVICVVEDDICFERFSEWPGEALLRLVHQAPNNWNILQLYSNNPDVLYMMALLRSQTTLILRERIDNICKVWSAGAYLLHKRAAQALMRKHHSNSAFILSGERPVADRLIYQLPEVYLSTDTLFSSNTMRSLIAPDHNDVDKVASILTQQLFAEEAKPEESKQSARVPAIIYLYADFDAETSRVSSADKISNYRNLIYVRAVLPEHVSGQSGEAWGVKFENRGQIPIRRDDMARILSVLKCVFIMNTSRLKLALVLEPGVDPYIVHQIVDLLENVELGNCDIVAYQLTSDAREIASSGTQPLALLITEGGARKLLQQYFNDGRFVLSGQRANVWEMLQLVCGIRIHNLLDMRR